ncbi:MAG: CAP domain-containing protein [Sporomusaceae bacterium]|nr:CAP domain-containing protein [Sporomusaceae bacterium]
MNKRWKYIGSCYLMSLLVYLAFWGLATAAPAVLSDRETSETVTSLRHETVQTLNFYRQAAGLTPFKEDFRLAKAAQGHGDYITRNYPQRITLDIHREQLGHSGFIGRDIGERGAYFGYFGTVGEALDPGGAFTVKQGVMGLWDSPYHRLLLVNPNFNDIGVGFGEKDGNHNILVLATGTEQAAKDERLVVYPYDGQKDAKLGWLVSEVPNPLRFWNKENIVTGYPITVSVHSSKVRELRLKQAILTDENGLNVACYQVDSSMETMESEKKHAFLIPREPLAWNKTYHVAAEGTLVYQDGSSAPWRKAWDFHTVSQLQVATITVEQSAFSDGRALELLRLATTAGDLPDLTYELWQGDRWIQRWDGRSHKFQFYQLLFLPGEYTLKMNGWGQSTSMTLQIYETQGMKKVALGN